MGKRSRTSVKRVEDLCRAARHGVLDERCNRRCVDLVMVPHVQAVVVLEVTGIGEVGNLCIRCVKIMSQIKYYKNKNRGLVTVK